ncbi:MAG: hypothetical protein HY961_12050 [Ignavibacteriae bacterium]|nr:hypothetical protein [Ignavibacteriota bacterium]
MTLYQLLKPISRLKSKELSPGQAWSMYQVDALVSTDYSSKDFSISIDGVSVCLTYQRRGEEPRERIKIPRQEFNKMIQWYTKPQRLRTVKEIARSVMRIGKEMEADQTG